MCLCFVHNINNSQTQKLLYFCVISLPSFGSAANNTILTRDGTAEPVSRDQILRRERGQGNIHFFTSHLTTSRVGNLTRLIHTLAIICDDHTYIPWYILYVVWYQPAAIILDYFVRFNQAQPISEERSPMKVLAEIAPISARILVENRSSEISDRKLPISYSVRHGFFSPERK